MSKFQKVFHWLGVLALFAAVVFGWNNLVSRLDPEFLSPYDEQTHFDYWWRIYEQKTLPAVYDKMHYEAMNLWACHGPNKERNPACSSELRGPSPHENSSTNYLPTFYAATAGMAWILSDFVETNDLFHLAKVANLAWALISVVLVAWLALALGIPALFAALVVFAISQTPAFVFAGITLTQEMFVLMCCLVGMILYVNKKLHASYQGFVFVVGAFAGVCLTIKPTAMLLPVVIVIAELLALERPLVERLRRAAGFSAVVIFVYVSLHVGLNHWRGVNESDGSMRDFLLGFRQNKGEAAFYEWAAYVWKAFSWSSGSLHWRTLVNWELPWLFMRFQPFVLMMVVLSIPYLLWCAYRRANVDLACRLFVGSMVAFVVLPVALAVYLLFIDFPYFFQPRYYTAYIVVAVIAGSAFLVDLIRQSRACVVFLCFAKKRNDQL